MKILINIWDFEDCNIVEIIDIDGNSYVGRVVDVTDIEDKSDLEEQEDSITILVNQSHIEFLQSEIKEIRKIN